MVGSHLMDIDCGLNGISRVTRNNLSASLPQDAVETNSAPDVLNDPKSTLNKPIVLTAERDCVAQSSKPERQYSRWTAEENQLVDEFFAKWLRGEGLPNKKVIEEFKTKYPQVKHAWNRIYTKIFNEKKTREMRAKKRLEKLNR